MKDNEKTISIILIVFLALFLIGGFSSWGMMGSPFGGMMSGFYGGYMLIFGWLIMILIPLALVLFIIWLIKQINK